MATVNKPLREWGISILRDKTHYLDRAMEDFRIEPARRFRMIAEPVDRVTVRRNGPAIA